MRFKGQKISQRLARMVRPHLEKMKNAMNPVADPEDSEPATRKRKTPAQEKLTSFLTHHALSKVEILSITTESQVGTLAITGDGRIPWSNSASIMDPFFKRDILEFYIILIQGPLTQFLLRSQLQSLIQSAQTLTTMQKTASIRSYLLEKFEAADSTRVMKRRRFLMSSLFDILQLGDTLDGSSPVLTERIVALLNLAAVVVERCYSKYERFEKEIATSIVYCKDWRKTSRRRFWTYLLHKKDVAKDSSGHEDVV